MSRSAQERPLEEISNQNDRRSNINKICEKIFNENQLFLQEFQIYVGDKQCGCCKTC